MIDAAQTAFLIACEKKRRSAVRTISLDETDTALAIAKGNKVLAS